MVILMIVFYLSSLANLLKPKHKSLRLWLMSTTEELLLRRLGRQEDGELAVYLQDLFRNFDTATMSP